MIEPGLIEPDIEIVRFFFNKDTNRRQVYERLVKKSYQVQRGMVGKTISLGGDRYETYYYAKGGGWARERYRY